MDFRIKKQKKIGKHKISNGDEDTKCLKMNFTKLLEESPTVEKIEVTVNLKLQLELKLSNRKVDQSQVTHKMP